MEKKFNNSKSKSKNAKYNGKRKTYNTKDYSDTVKRDRTMGDVMSKRTNLDDITSNDISWYNRSPLYPLVTRIPWNQIMGAATEEPLRDWNFGEYRSLPGVMTIDFAPTIGWAEDMDSAVNRAFNLLYSDIVSRTTGALQMQQMDLAIMTIGVSSIACHLGYAKKIMGTYSNYSSLNYYFPRAVIRAMGINFDDLVLNAADYQVQLTDLINRFNRLLIPNFSDLHVRQYALSHNLYTDSESVFGQIINFRPYVLYTFNDLDHALEATEVWSVDPSWGVITFGEYLNVIRNALKLWENSSVTPIVAGNVRRAYPDSAMVHIDQFDPTYRTVPVVDRNITWQVNNMRWHDLVVESLNITQDPVRNILVCKPKYHVGPYWALYPMNREYFLLNTYDGSVNDEFIMESTRLLPFINLDEHVDTDGNVYVRNCPSELVARVAIFTIVDPTDPEDDAALNIVIQGTSDNVITTSDLSATELIIRNLSDFIKWRNGPGIMYSFYDTGEDQFVGRGVSDSREIQLYTHLHQDQLEKLHLAAAQSLFWAQGFKVGK